MYTSLRLCGGNTLYAVHSRFVFQCPVNVITRHAANDFLETAGCPFVGAGYFHFPAFGFAILGIHTEKVAGKDSGFVASCTATDFENRILAILRVGGNKHQFDFLFQYGKTFLTTVHFFFCHFAHIGIRFIG